MSDELLVMDDQVAHDGQEARHAGKTVPRWSVPREIWLSLLCGAKTFQPSDGEVIDEDFSSTDDSCLGFAYFLMSFVL